MFEDSTPLSVIEALRPDVLIKGEDYAEADIVGSIEVRSWGGRVLRAPLVDGHSTSAILNRLNADG
jgi:D-beta-D-heptose 7-phosphate kinase/D-beta-D-heptose 1-phosphate adenosyltransferase